MSLLALPGHLRAELSRVSFIGGDSGDTFLPESDVDSGLVEQHRSQFSQQFTPGHAQLEERILTQGANLGRQHSSGRTPAFAPALAALEEEHPATRLSQFAGAGRAHRTASNYNDVKGLCHDLTEETF
jgi:hypothetical protein